MPQNILNFPKLFLDFVLHPDFLLCMQWLGMGNQELLNYFSAYDAVKARHAYGPQGHRGLSVLIFEASAIGYLEAERLHKHFAEQGTDRDAWFSHHRRLFLPGGLRQLYGYMAIKEDLDFFNRHCQGSRFSPFSFLCCCLFYVIWLHVNKAMSMETVY